MNCPICAKSFSSSRIFYFPSYHILTCSHCETRFCQPLVDNKDIYDSQFMNENSEYYSMKHLTFEHAKELIPYLAVKNKRVLDIGCATGNFLETLKEDNQVMGLELNKVYEPFLKKKGISYKLGSLDANLKSLPDGSFDIISLWDVFEHLEDPVTIIKLAKTKLSPEGIIINWTNNYNDWISWFAEMTYRGTFGELKAFMERSFNRSDGHNFNFTPKSLSILYQNLKLRVVETIITDTPAYRLSRSIPFRIILGTFYFLNAISKKGKIICHVLKKGDTQNAPES